jgi:hypothetical protein
MKLRLDSRTHGHYTTRRMIPHFVAERCQLRSLTTEWYHAAANRSAGLQVCYVQRNGLDICGSHSAGRNINLISVHFLARWLVLGRCGYKYNGSFKNNAIIFGNQPVHFRTKCHTVEWNEVKLSRCLTKHHAMKTYWGSRGIAQHILWHRHYMEVSGQLHATAALTPGKEPLLPVGYEVEWVPEPIWTRCRREKFPAPAGIRTPIIRSSSP